jgi:hypothetical protein
MPLKICPFTFLLFLPTREQKLHLAHHWESLRHNEWIGSFCCLKMKQGGWIVQMTLMGCPITATLLGWLNLGRHTSSNQSLWLGSRMPHLNNPWEVFPLLFPGTECPQVEGRWHPHRAVFFLPPASSVTFYLSFFHPLNLSVWKMRWCIKEFSIWRAHGLPSMRIILENLVGREQNHETP